jgi:hypothetical protein
MTDQEFYDTPIAHLVKQGTRAFQSTSGWDERCYYRTSEGLKCAAGVHIPDSLYTSEMEGWAIPNVVEDYPELAPYFPNLELAQDLQELHDSEFSWNDAGGLSLEGRYRAKQIARAYELIPYAFDAPIGDVSPVNGA